MLTAAVPQAPDVLVFAIDRLMRIDDPMPSMPCLSELGRSM